MTLCLPASLSRAASSPARELGRALLWLVVLSTTFYASYGFANWMAGQRAAVPVLMFDWERWIPFLPWTILPYWSINLFFALAVFLCRDRRELDIHVRRVLTAQGIAILCFLLFPLQLGVEKPATDGVAEFLFATLAGFDRPYNQAPSLHIALLVILRSLYARHVPKRFHPLLHGWALLIGVSVLTTWQHHFIDLPTGALLGLACLWLWPDHGKSPLKSLALTREPRRLRIGAVYGVASLCFALLAALIGGWGLWLFWPAVSLALVAANYLALGAKGFQKCADGTMPLPIRLLLAPYLLGARLNARAWTRGDTAAEIGDGVWLGALHDAPDRRFATVIDLCAELPAGKGAACHVAFPSLDLIPSAQDRLQKLATAIELARKDGSVLVACALGYGRSAAAIAAWLVSTGRAPSLDAAFARVQVTRPRAMLS